MTKNKFNVGIIGMGYIGESHVEAVRRIGLCNLYAVADTNARLAQNKAEQYGIPHCCATVEELLGDPGLDAVHNCTPNHLHTAINKQIIASGKHLLSEKPLAMSFAEASEVAALAKQHPGICAAVNYNYRMNPMVQEMRSRIRTGKIGRVRIATGMYQQDWLLKDTDYSWRLEPEFAGPSCAVSDIGTHWMDMFQHVTGDRINRVMADLETILPVRRKPRRQTETFASASHGEYDEVAVTNEEYAAVLFKTVNGVTGCFHVSEMAAGHGCYFGIEVNGSEGSYRWNQEDNDRLWAGYRDGDNAYIIRNPNTISPDARSFTSLALGHPEGWNDAFKNNIYAFYKYIADGMSGEPLFATLDQAAYLARLTEAVILSSKEGRWVNIDEVR